MPIPAGGPTLTDGQVQLRDLIMGPGTPYRFVTHFNPFSRSTRTDQSAARTWADGSWSGAEWTEQATIAMRLVVMGVGAAGWLTLMRPLLAAFAPAPADLDLRFCIAGAELLMRGRPRLVDPEARHVDGHVYVAAAFVALDPTVYSGEEHRAQLGLPSTIGGLTLPLTLPAIIDAQVTSGRTTIANTGTKPVGLQLRVDGPVVEPRITLQTAAGTTTLRLYLTLTAGQWLDIDTATRTVYLNGTASRRGQAAGDWPVLPPGEADLAFDAGVYDPAASLTVLWRDAWH